MKAKILDGKKIAQGILEKLKREIIKKPLQIREPRLMKSGGKLKLTLAVVQIGKNPVSQVFIEQKRKACEKVDIGFKLYQFDAKISQEKLKENLENIVKNPQNSGIILQLPVPAKFSAEEFLNLIPQEKDVDVLSEKSLGKFYQGISPILPPVAGAVLELLKSCGQKLQGKNVVIVGAGKLVGKPLAVYFLKQGATTSVLNEHTKDISFFTKKADILISGVGKPNLITGKMIKTGVVVIDAGASFVKGKVVGDVDFQSVSKKASFISPVPGGVGPLTVACLLKNLTRVR